MQLVYIILLLMVVSGAEATQGKIGLCTKECEVKVASLYTEIYQEIYNAISEKQKKQFINLVVKNYDSRIKKATGKFKNDLEAELSALKEGEMQEEHFKRISQIDPMNNDGSILKQLGSLLQKDELKKIIQDYSSSMAAGMACIAQCRDPEGLNSGWDQEKANIYTYSKE